MAGTPGDISEWEVNYVRNSALLCVISVLLYFLYKHLNRKGQPPFYAGWLPWIGCAIEFGKSPLLQIDRFKNQLGPVFTLGVAGKRLTFLMEEEDFHSFFSSNSVDFQAAVQDPVLHTASVTKESFMKYHTNIHDTVKWNLAPKRLDKISEPLHAKFQGQLNQWGEKGVHDLNGLVRKTMYITVLDNLFGENTLPTYDIKAYEELETFFVKYDDQFEYGSQLPEMFLGDWSRAKWYLIGKFDAIADKMLPFDKQRPDTLLATLFDSVDRPHAGKYGLLLMWASLANAIPITFWTVAFILSHPEVTKKVRKEVETLWNEKPTEVDAEWVGKFSYIKKCALEAIRLRSPGAITRAVVKPMKIRGYKVPVGDLLMLSPYWAHRNERFFPQPELFQPERWDAADLDKNQFLDGFIAFGGGRYQCPGRWFALLEIQLIIAMVFHQFDMELLNPVPQPSTLHLVGSPQPDGPLEVSYTKRDQK